MTAPRRRRLSLVSDTCEEAHASKRRGSQPEALQGRCGSCRPRTAGSGIPKRLKGSPPALARHRSIPGLPRLPDACSEPELHSVEGQLHASARRTPAATRRRRRAPDHGLRDRQPAGLAATEPRADARRRIAEMRLQAVEAVEFRGTALLGAEPSPRCSSGAATPGLKASQGRHRPLAKTGLSTFRLRPDLLEQLENYADPARGVTTEAPFACISVRALQDLSKRPRGAPYNWEGRTHPRNPLYYR